MAKSKNSESTVVEKISVVVADSYSNITPEKIEVVVDENIDTQFAVDNDADNNSHAELLINNNEPDIPNGEEILFARSNAGTPAEENIMIVSDSLATDLETDIFSARSFELFSYTTLFNNDSNPTSLISSFNFDDDDSTLDQILIADDTSNGNTSSSSNNNNSGNNGGGGGGNGGGSGNPDTTTFNLNDLTDQDHYIITTPALAGEEQFTSIGLSSDFDGDGLGEIFVGKGKVGNTNNSVYSVYDSALETLDTADGDNDNTLAANSITNGTGEIITSGGSDGAFGFQIVGNGDINGDGYDDVIISVFNYSGVAVNAGGLYVLFGSSSGLEAIDITTLDGTNGVRLEGSGANSMYGTNINMIGDIDNDGRADFILEGNNNNYLIIYGNTDFESSGGVIDLTDTNDFHGTVIDEGTSGHNFHRVSIDSVDINGDGIADLVVGTPRYSIPLGASDVGMIQIFLGQDGGLASTLDFDDANIADYKINSATADAMVGYTVSDVGDVNGDGLDDLAFNLPAENGGLGRVHLIYSGYWDEWDAADSSTDGNLDLSLLTNIASNAYDSGFWIDGIANNGASIFGNIIKGDGDFNGDGYDDFIVVDNDNEQAYLIFGKAGGYSGNLDVNGLDGINGITIYDDAADLIITDVAKLTDLNGDGYDDLAFTTEDHLAYIIYGYDVSNEVTESGESNITGTSANEILIGTSGNDTIVSAGGIDIIRSGAGSDLITVSDLNFAKVDGGTGTDTLNFAMSGETIDFTELKAADGIQGLVKDIEHLRLTGSNNTINLNRTEVLNLSSLSNIVRISSTTSLNSLALALGDVWVERDDVVINSQTYKVYTSGEATLQVQNNINVTGPISQALFTEYDDVVDFNDVTSQQINDTISLNGTLYDALAGHDEIILPNAATKPAAYDEAENFNAGAGNDIITTGDLDDIVFGGTGNDTIYGSDAGNDLLRGEGGIDTLNYSLLANGITIDLLLKDTTKFNGDTDDFNLFEIIYATSFADTLNYVETLNTPIQLITGLSNLDIYTGNGADEFTVDVDYTANQIIFFFENFSIDTGANNDTVTLSLDFNATVDDAVIESEGSSIILGAGNDTFVLSVFEGVDSISDAILYDGGADTDTLDFSNLTSGITVNLASTSFTYSSIAQTNVINFENIIGTDQNDTLAGNSSANVFTGGSGDDSIDGNGGTDTALYSENHADYTISVNLGMSAVIVEHDNLTDGEDTLTEVEFLDFADKTVGYFIGTGGDDSFTNSQYEDNFYGNGGNNTVSYAASIAGITVDLSTGIVSNDGYNNTDNLNDIQNIIGSAFNDAIIDSTESNTIDGGAGDDTLTVADLSGYYTPSSASDGALVLTHASQTETITNIETLISTQDALTFKVFYGTAADNTFTAFNSPFNIFVGGDGVDTIDYSTAPIAVDLQGVTQNNGYGGRDVTLSIERVIGTDGDDILSISGTDKTKIFFLMGGDGADSLIKTGLGSFYIEYSNSISGVNVDFTQDLTIDDGFGNQDTFSSMSGVLGSAFADTLIGADNFNKLEGLAGNDTITGGTSDYVEYTHSISGINIDLSQLTASDDGFGDQDSIIGIENIIGSHFDDIMIGSDNDNILQGLAGADVFNPGLGFDYAEYSRSISGINIDLSQELALDDGFGDQDTLFSTEGIIGSNFADTIVGSNGINNLQGGEGNDTLTGGQGNDTLTGGLDNDTFIFNIGDGADVIEDFDTALFGTADADQIDLSAFNIAGATDQDKFDNLNKAQVGGDVVIDLGGGDTITLSGGDVNALSAADFIF